ncbi:hypothetical protein SLEP1_g37997 [Rubroshorea leprosula]|nr:hypothetical protein SLEP1_g37997 [Rubroshorea leprosula]
MREATSEISQLNVKGETVQLSEEEIERRKQAFLILWDNMRYKERVQITEADKMKEESAIFFEETFTEKQWMRPSVEGLQFKQIAPADNDYLIASFTKEGIKTVVWDCESSKAPGLDGFNFKFIKSEWETIKGDVTEFFHEFQKNGKIVKGGIYKILAKLLANRLKKVLVGIVGEQQMAFLSGRQLMDGVVIVNEVIDEVKKKRKEAFLFKIDFEKAYDKVSWRFLDFMLQKTGFSNTWRKWIMECLRSSMVSVVVNGSPTRQFSIFRGLQQGDPLCPFLFLIIVEGINGLVLKAVEKGLIEGVEVGDKGFKITHLQYADDTLLFGTAIEENVWAMKSILRTFELVSGLKINFNKSQLIGIGEWEAFILEPVLEGVTRKLSTWKGRYLSLGGRITLIHSVLSSLPVFWMSMYVIPKGTILFLDKIRRRFLWGGVEGGKKINWVRWDKVCRDKEQGGLGVKDLRKFNLALLGKWWGRLVNEEDGLWKEVILQKYGRVGEPRFNWLRRVMVLGLDGGGICRLNVIDHENEGCWIWKLQWRRRLYSWEVQEETEILKEIQETTITKGKTDVREWIHSNNGFYTTRSAYKALTLELEREQLGVTLQKVWNAMVPSKVLAFSWQLLQDKIPTKANLFKRGGGELEQRWTEMGVRYSNSILQLSKWQNKRGLEMHLVARTGSTKVLQLDEMQKERMSFFIVRLDPGPGILLKRGCSKKRQNRVTIPG